MDEMQSHLRYPLDDVWKLNNKIFYAWLSLLIVVSCHDNKF